MVAELDPVDRLLLDELGEVPSGRVVVLGDETGALARALVERAGASTLQDPRVLQGWAGAGEQVVAHSDSLVAERQVAQALAGASGGGEVVPDLAEALTGAALVVLRLPKSLDALDEIARTAALLGTDDVRVVAGGRVKHMTPSMNEVLGASFEQVHASLGRQKSRVLHAAGPRTVEQVWPRQRHHADLDLTIHAHGAAFAGTRIDAGTRLLLGQLDRLSGTDGTVVDLGCGTGVLASVLARRFDDVVAIDVSAAAVASAQLTTAGAADVRRGDGLTDLADASVATIVSNPPFHVGTAKDSTPTLAMIADAKRVLRPGGELVLVYNSHLPYLPRLREVGPTEILARDRSYLVTRTVRA
ncbi:class I SAM-dependent methyltransferase [Janibacter sp. G349]|uniref:class I SAM-dependent methyltransferase n=1 Tax=Janibacter sp. G349 TaxID=3405424 RepID=UPI003B7BBB5D